MCVDRAVPPIFIVHGTPDTLVPVDDSRMFWAALKERRARDRSAAGPESASASASASSTAAGAGSGADEDVFIEVPLAHHAFNFILSPRTFAMGDAAVDWMNAVYKSRGRRRRAEGGAASAAKL
jgi:hypothetical protein